MPTDSTKTRFCPSPTGLLHIGNIRTALFNALYAKSVGGQFLLRIEDTDRERSDVKYTQALYEDLRWLGLEWDEGPQHEKDAGPYLQSERQPIYDEYYHHLEEQNIAYPCFCSEEQLALTRKIQRSQGKPPRYPGTCRSLTAADIQAKLDAGLKPTLRFRVPDDQDIVFTDLVRGEQRFASNDIGDFIIRRADGTSPFMFCNAVDDALMGVTHAMRGEDHVTNTPRQLLILTALGLPLITYGHISLIVAPDGSPLSKRHGSRSIQVLREEGYLPDAINNYLARLGHYYGHDDYLSLDQLAEQFKIASLSKSPAKFNMQQLHYWQKLAVENMDAAATWAWLGNDIQQMIPTEYQIEFMVTVKPNIAFPSEAKEWATILFNPGLSLADAENDILKQAGPDYFKVAIAAIDESGVQLAAIIEHLKKVLGLKGKALYMPLRVALTGKPHGPELANILNLISEQEIRKRLEMAQ